MTKTPKDRPTGVASAVPAGLAVIPTDHWFQVKTGEVLLGHFKDPKGRDVIAFASHNAYQSQAVLLELGEQATKAEIFDRKSGQWVKPETSGNKVEFNLAEYAIELLRIER